MKQLTITLICAIVFSLVMPQIAGARSIEGVFSAKFCNTDLPSITAEAYALFDLKTGMVLVGQNLHRSMHPASLTKLMTLLVAAELTRGDERVRISSTADSVPGSSMRLNTGEVWKVEDLIMGLMLVSGNDAAIALAEHVGGRVEDFGVLMTSRAEMMGMENSTFKNPHGLTQPGHLTSAYDLALLTSTVLSNPKFKQIVSTRLAEVRSLCTDSVTQLKNTNRLLHENVFFKGAKTGTTSAAGNCLIAIGGNATKELGAVILKSADRYGDARRLIEWGMEEFEWHTLVRSDRAVSSVAVRDWGEQERLGIRPLRDVIIPVPPEAKNDIFFVVNRPYEIDKPSDFRIGEMAIFYEQQSILRIDLYSCAEN